MDNKMLASDGLIVCNNCISKGESITRNTSDGTALDDFNNTVLQDDRVSSVRTHHKNCTDLAFKKKKKK